MGTERAVSFSWSRKQGRRGLASQNDMVIMVDDAPLADGDFGAGRLKRFGISNLSSVGTDFGASTQAYKVFERCAQQDEKPQNIYLGKRDAEEAAVHRLAFGGATDTGDTITGAVNGTAISVGFSSDDATTLGLLKTALEAVWGVASATITGSDVDITATPGFVLNVGEFQANGGNEPEIVTSVITAGRTIYDDIIELLAENDIPYVIYHTSANKGEIEAAALAVSTRNKFHICQSADPDVYASGSEDIASRTKAAGYWKTSIWVSKDTTKHIPAALAAQILANPAGSIAFSYRDLQGITPDAFTSDEIGYIEAKNANTYNALNADIASTLPGITSDGSQAHTVRDQHYMEAAIDARGIYWLKQQKKASFTDANLQSAGAELQLVVNQMEFQTVLDSEYENIIETPTKASIPDADKSAYIASGFYGDVKMDNVIIKLTGSIDNRVA